MADPILVTPGQTLSPADWDALTVQQHGGIKSVQKREPTKEERQRIEDAGGDLDQNPIYRYYLGDGTYIETRTADNGVDSAVVDYKPSAKFTQNPANKPPTASSVRPTNVYVGTNPATGKPTQVSEYPDGHKEYDDTQVPAPPAADKEWHTEGTPDGQGGYDNSRPIMVRTVNGKRETRSLTSAELKDWNEAGQRTRNPGGKTDDEMRAEAARNAPKPVATNTTEPFIVQAGPDGKLTTTPNPNYQGEKPQRSTVKGSDGKTYIVSVDKDGKATAAAVEGLPDDKRPGQVVTLNGETYWATPNADPSQPPTLTHMNPGAVPKDDGPQMEPGMSPSDYLQRRRQWLMEQRRAGVSQKEIDDIWARNVQEATARQNEASLAATQQNQRLSSAMSGFGQAMSSVQEINKYLPEGSDLGGKALEAFLGIQRGQAQRMGGYGDPYAGSPSSMVAAIPGPPPMNPPKPSAPSPVGAVANGVTATTAAAVNPTGANVQTATDATMQGSRAAFGALGVSQLDGNERPDDVITVRDNISGETKTLTRAQYDEQVQNYPHVPQTTTVLDAKPAQAQASPSPVSAIPESPYDFQARIASKPPWMMTEDDYRKAQQMGMEQDFWATGA